MRYWRPQKRSRQDDTSELKHSDTNMVVTLQSDSRGMVARDFYRARVSVSWVGFEG